MKGVTNPYFEHAILRGSLLFRFMEPAQKAVYIDRMMNYYQNAKLIKEFEYHLSLINDYCVEDKPLPNEDKEISIKEKLLFKLQQILLKKVDAQVRKPILPIAAFLLVMVKIIPYIASKEMQRLLIKPAEKLTSLTGLSQKASGRMQKIADKVGRDERHINGLSKPAYVFYQILEGMGEIGKMATDFFVLYTLTFATTSTVINLIAGSAVMTSPVSIAAFASITLGIGFLRTATPLARSFHKFINLRMGNDFGDERLNTEEREDKLFSKILTRLYKHLMEPLKRVPFIGKYVKYIKFNYKVFEHKVLKDYLFPGVETVPERVQVTEPGSTYVTIQEMVDEEGGVVVSKVGKIALQEALKPLKSVEESHADFLNEERKVFQLNKEVDKVVTNVEEKESASPIDLVTF